MGVFSRRLKGGNGGKGIQRWCLRVVVCYGCETLIWSGRCVYIFIHRDVEKGRMLLRGVSDLRLGL